MSGQLHAAEGTVRRALGINRERKDEFRESVSLQYIGLAQAARQPKAADRAQNDVLHLNGHCKYVLTKMTGKAKDW